MKGNQRTHHIRPIKQKRFQKTLGNIEEHCTFYGKGVSTDEKDPCGAFFSPSTAPVPPRLSLLTPANHERQVHAHHKSNSPVSTSTSASTSSGLNGYKSLQDGWVRQPSRTTTFYTSPDGIHNPSISTTESACGSQGFVKGGDEGLGDGEGEYQPRADHHKLRYLPRVGSQRRGKNATGIASRFGTEHDNGDPFLPLKNMSRMRSRPLTQLQSQGKQSKGKKTRIQRL